MNKKNKRKYDYHIERLNDGLGFWVRSHGTVASANSKFQKIEVLNTNFGRTLRIDDYFMTSDRDEFFYHENMIHPSAISHYAPRRAIIIGGGDGGAAKEYLKYSSIEEVVMVEIDKVVVDFCKEHLPLVHQGAFDDPRLQVLIEDGKKYVEDCTSSFDLMMLDLTDPFGPSEMLYRVDFLENCKRILGDEGVLSMHLGSPVTRPNVFHRIYSSLKNVFDIVQPYQVYVPLYGAVWGMATASVKTNPRAFDASTVNERLKARKIKDLKYYNGEAHVGLFGLPNYVKDLISGALRPISESDPMDEPGLNPDSQVKLEITEINEDQAL